MMSTAMSTEQEPRRGRPAKSAEEKKRQVSVYLSKETIEHLTEISANTSTAIEQLVKRVSSGK